MSKCARLLSCSAAMLVLAGCCIETENTCAVTLTVVYVTPGALPGSDGELDRVEIEPGETIRTTLPQRTIEIYLLDENDDIVGGPFGPYTVPRSGCLEFKTCDATPPPPPPILSCVKFRNVGEEAVTVVLADWNVDPGIQEFDRFDLGGGETHTICFTPRDFAAYGISANGLWSERFGPFTLPPASEISLDVIPPGEYCVETTNTGSEPFTARYNDATTGEQLGSAAPAPGQTVRTVLINELTAWIGEPQQTRYSVVGYLDAACGSFGPYGPWALPHPPQCLGIEAFASCPEQSSGQRANAAGKAAEMTLTGGCTQCGDQNPLIMTILDEINRLLQPLGIDF